MSSLRRIRAGLTAGPGKATRPAGTRLAGTPLAVRRPGPVHGRMMVFVDGGSRGNPGPAGAGAVVYDSGGRLVSGRGRPLGHATNNEAEYAGLLLGLELARELGAERLEVRADSELLVRQMRGEYRVRAGNLRGLADRARGLLGGFAQAVFVAVPRELNRRADRLADRAMDSGAEVAEGPEGPVTAGGERSER